MSQHPEAALQRQVAEWLDWVLMPPWYYTAIGHGGGGELRGKMLRGMGMKRGVYDFLLLGPDRAVGWIELKSAKGRETPEQTAFGVMNRTFGHLTCVVRTLDELHMILNAWNVPLRTAKPMTAAVRRGFAPAGATVTYHGKEFSSLDDWPASTDLSRRRRKA